MLTEKHGQNQPKDASDKSKDDLIDGKGINVDRGHEFDGIADAEEAAGPAGEHRVEQKKEEELVIAEAYCIADPWAEMIHLQDTFSRHRTFTQASNRGLEKRNNAALCLRPC